VIEQRARPAAWLTDHCDFRTSEKISNDSFCRDRSAESTDCTQTSIVGECVSW